MRRAFLPLMLFLFAATAGAAEPLPRTKPLTRDGDLAAQMVEGIDKYLMRETAASIAKRKEYWKPDSSSPAAYTKSIEPNRQRLRKILGVVDERVPFKDLEYVGGPKTPSLVAETDAYKVYAVRWPVLPGVEGDGLLLEPTAATTVGVVAIPDAAWTPEMVVGLAPGVPEEAQFARRLAECGARVLVPTLINRDNTWSGNPKLGRMTNQPHREFLYRMAYEMGRHPLGFEVQKVLAAVDWLSQSGVKRVNVYGYGEGGRVALYSGALDERIHETAVSGAFGPREDVWQEPIDHNVWGLLREFGDAEVAANLFGSVDGWEHELLIENTLEPIWDGPAPPRDGRSGGAAPGRLKRRGVTVVGGEYARVEKLIEGRKVKKPFYIALSAMDEPFHLVEAETIKQMGQKYKRADKPPKDLRKDFDPAPRQKRQFDQLVAFTQKLLRDSEQRRQETFWSKLDTSSPEKYAKSIEPFRKQLWEEVIGKLPAPTEPMNPQTRQLYDEPKWTGYEVTLDLYPDVFAYGILLLPRGMKPGEKRPVVVCQHGLEGRPTDVTDPTKTKAPYHAFAAQLADRGYIVYAPQNPYIGQDKFRVLQRKANPLGLSLFSFIVRQHERTLDWLATLPNVDADKMAFYGLSYGGKTAMRVPAILPRYCLSICSGDFNEWVAKNASVDFKGSYMFSGEYEMPEFNLGHTFNYAEMAALIAPRPFMVERGHDDGVGIDEMIAWEYAKVRRLYSRLKLPERTEIEFFAGVHEIHGDGTFKFLEKHLK